MAESQRGLAALAISRGTSVQVMSADDAAKIPIGTLARGRPRNMGGYLLGVGPPGAPLPSVETDARSFAYTNRMLCTASGVVAAKPNGADPAHFISASMEASIQSFRYDPPIGRNIRRAFTPVSHQAVLPISDNFDGASIFFLRT